MVVLNGKKVVREVDWVMQDWRFGLELQLLIRILLKGDGEELGVFFGVAAEHLELLMETCD